VPLRRVSPRGELRKRLQVSASSWLLLLTRKLLPRAYCVQTPELAAELRSPCGKFRLIAIHSAAVSGVSESTTIQPGSASVVKYR
jgi:hypothetical protein